jgi:hypothetical protein
MKDIAEQFAAISLSELCGGDETITARVQELDLLDCDKLKKTEVDLTYRHLSALESHQQLDEADRLTLEALSYVLLKKYIEKQLPLTDSQMISRAA